MIKRQKQGTLWRPDVSPRALVLGVLGAVTVGVAVLSVAVSYGIIVPAFGPWAVPTVVALDALWVVMQATEVLAGSNASRARRVQVAGLVLTAVIAAIPTIDLAMTLTREGAAFDLAVILTPTAIVATKFAWWIVLPALGRRTSHATRQTIAVKRQEVADQLEVMEAEAAHRIELLRVARDLEQRVTEAETEFRLAALTSRQRVTDELHAQAVTTEETIAAKELPAIVAQIVLPDLDGWEPSTPALPVAPAVTLGTQVSALEGPRPVTSRGTPVTLADLATVTGVTVPMPGEPLTDAQLGLVLRHLRYSSDPPCSYRQACTAFRAAGYSGSEERVRRVWAALMAKESAPRSGAGQPDAEEAEEEADAPH